MIRFLYVVSFLITFYANYINSGVCFKCCCCQCLNNDRQSRNSFKSKKPISNPRLNCTRDEVIKDEPTVGSVDNIKENDLKTFVNTLDEESKKNFLESTEADIKNYVQLLKEYQKTENIGKIKVEKTESVHRCKKITLENEEIIYVKKDKKKNKFYIDLLKHLGLCDLEYFYNGDYILTKQLENMIPLNTKTKKQFENTRDIIQNAKNLVPFYTILATLNLQDCSFKNISNICAVQEGENYVLKIIDIDLYKELDDFKTYEDFYSILEEGTDYSFDYWDEKKILENNNDGKYKDFNKIYITLDLPPSKIIKELCKYLGSEDNISQDISKIYKILADKRYGLISFYIDGYKNYVDDIDRYNHMKNVFENEFNCDPEAFIVDFLNYTFEYKNDDDEVNFQERLKNTTLKTKDEYFDFVKKILNSRIYEATISLIERHNFITEYLINRVKSMTNEEKEETRKLFGEMIDFLIANYKNTNYNSYRYNLTIEKILKMKESNLFSFIFAKWKNERANELKFRG